jgi:hypothetical protein
MYHRAASGEGWKPPIWCLLMVLRKTQKPISGYIEPFIYFSSKTLLQSFEQFVKSQCKILYIMGKNNDQVC